MTLLVAPDSFKGTFTAVQVAEAIAGGVEEAGAVADRCPVADGGEGTLEILLGALFLLIVLFVPRGIVPTAGEWLRRLRTRGRPAVAPVQTSTRAETRA